MKQSKFSSFVEAVYGTSLGFLISMIVGRIVFPIYGFQVTTNQNVQIILLFTITSFIRSYYVRRMFNIDNNELLKVVVLFGLFIIALTLELY